MISYTSDGFVQEALLQLALSEPGLRIHLALNMLAPYKKVSEFAN